MTGARWAGTGEVQVRLQPDVSSFGWSRRGWASTESTGRRGVSGKGPAGGAAGLHLQSGADVWSGCG